MARRRQRTREYPFIPRSFLIREHNTHIRRDSRPAWRLIAIDKRQAQDLNKYDREDNEVLCDWVLEQRILHYQMVAHMARNKSRIEPIRQSTGLAEPFGSAPRFPGKYEVRFKYANGLKQNIHIFAAEYAAWHFIHATINGNKIRWLDPHRFQAGDVIVQSKHLQLLTEYSPTNAERAWVLPIPYSYYAWHIATGEPWSSKTAAKFDTHNPERDSKQRPAGRSSRSERTKSRDTGEYSPIAARKRRVQSTDGTTFGIPELAASTGKDASKVRGALRKSGIEKPADGWTWPVAQQDSVLAALKKFLK